MKRVLKRIFSGFLVVAPFIMLTAVLVWVSKLIGEFPTFITIAIGLLLWLCYGIGCDKARRKGQGGG